MHSKTAYVNPLDYKTTLIFVRAVHGGWIWSLTDCEMTVLTVACSDAVS